MLGRNHIMNRNFLKILRFSKIYGVSRTLVKICGRVRRGIYWKPFCKKRDILGIVGCGQFGFSTIAYFAMRNKFGFASCFDTDREQSEGFAKFFRVGKIAGSFEELLDNKEVSKLFIASNHFSHTEYACIALEKGLDVHLEKPISVTFDQLKKLIEAKENSEGSLAVGYNRPYSEAVVYIRKKISGNLKPISLNCFIAGHLIDSGHWYRIPREGTRICGNVGHWLDLAVHLFNVREVIPNIYNVTISYSNPETDPDDNLSISFSTDFGDIVNIMLTARSEPFEGINETINLQSGTIIAKIDDYRSMQYWNDSEYKKFKYRPKDVGHEGAIMQILSDDPGREWREIEISTILMLSIKEMVLKKETCHTIDIRKIFKDLERDSLTH